MYYLKLEYDNRIISIPFGKLKDIDNYTMHFKDRTVFLDRLLSILNLDIDKNYVSKIYLINEDYRLDEFDYEKCLPIRYNKDNYNIDSLRDCFTDYLQKDHNRIRMFDIIHVKLSAMMEFKDGKRDISDEEIRQAVFAYFKNNYVGQREIYFILSNEYKIKKDKFMLANREFVRDELSKLESREDDYLEYLIELFYRGEEDRLRAIEELSLMDMEELNSRLSNASYGVLDGVSNLSIVKEEDIVKLEELTGMNIEDIRKMALSSLGRRR